MGKLKPLYEILGEHCPAIHREILISDITDDSRQCTGGSLFFALKGESSDGRAYIQAAIDNGARVIVVEKEETSKYSYGEDIVYIEVSHLKQHLGLFANCYFSYPSQKLSIVGITGTNGKTSVAHFVAQLLGQLGHKAGYLGTLGCGELENLSPTTNTTLGVIELNRQLALMVKSNISFVAIEVSSHALEQNRINGINIDCAIFTNLTQEHLDYHGSMENYWLAKQKLFLRDELKSAVIFTDDKYGLTLFSDKKFSDKNCSQGFRKVAIGTKKVVNNDAFYCHIKKAQETPQGFACQVDSSWGKQQLELPLIGHFNVANTLLAVAALATLGFEFDSLIKAAARLQSVPGRMEECTALLLQQSSRMKEVRVIIDYAHTPDALEQVLTSVKKHCSGNLWCVFGCGGDRDRSKRAPMGKIAARNADYCVVTSDNPRHESPTEIIDQIIAGVDSQESKVIIKVDRVQAIAYAWEHAAPNDWILISGKGHETYQEIEGKRYFLSDKDTLRQVVRSSSM